VFDAAWAGALRLADAGELARMDWPFPLPPLLGLRRAMRWDAYARHTKAAFKRALYSACGFEPSATWRENLRARLRPVRHLRAAGADPAVPTRPASTP
jgi:hypothetical protein